MVPHVQQARQHLGTNEEALEDYMRVLSLTPDSVTAEAAVAEIMAKRTEAEERAAELKRKEENAVANPWEVLGLEPSPDVTKEQIKAA